MSGHYRSLIVVGALATGLFAGCSGHPSTPAAHGTAAKPAPHVTFGSFPTFLPKAAVDGSALHKIVTGSSASPALATQGDTVKVLLAHGSVLATVTGPEVPNEGLPTQAPTSPATFTLTFSEASEDVPLSAKAFQAIDDQGQVYDLVPPTGSTVPADIKPGQQVSFKLFATIVTGEGRLRWIPSGHLAPVEWDYVIEDD